MMKRIVVCLGLLITLMGGLFVAPVMAAQEPPGDDGVFFWNEDYTLEEGERIEGDLIVFGGDVVLHEDSEVDGTVVVWNGNLTVEGTVQEDVVVTNGDIELTDDARVEGNVVCSWDCALDRAEGARIEGNVIEGTSMRGVRIPGSSFRFRDFWATGTNRLLEFIFSLLRTAASIIVVSLIAGGIALIWPQGIERVMGTLRNDPLPSAGVGVLTVFAAALLALALLLTICLPPLIALVLVAAGIFGWSGVGALVGRRLLAALNVSQTEPVWSATIGTLLISLVSSALGLVPCVAIFSWLLVGLIGCLGLGAVVLTRFGTMDYPV